MAAKEGETYSSVMYNPMLVLTQEELIKQQSRGVFYTDTHGKKVRDLGGVSLSLGSQSQVTIQRLIIDDKYSSNSSGLLLVLTF